MTNIPQNNTPPKTPAFRNAYEYAERWRSRGHDALWVANEVWNKVHFYYSHNGLTVGGGDISVGYDYLPWQGFTVEDYRLTPEETTFYQAKIDAVITRAREAAERAEKNRLAEEARKKYVEEYLQHLRDNGITKMQVKVAASIGLPDIVCLSTEAVKYNGERIVEEAVGEQQSALEALGFTDVTFEGSNNYDHYMEDATAAYSAIYEVDLAAEYDDEMTEFVTNLLKNDINSKFSANESGVNVEHIGEDDLALDDVEYEIIIPDQQFAI